ncbi:MAG: hypothetical protein HYZ54_13440, partial [Ignavibacteriae bacterium]|nr:hypothetical protein [Ignavibacteriota bacterium]
ISVGRLFGKATGTFNGVINFALPDSLPQNYSGTMESKVEGWIFELGVKHFFDASFHPFVGIGARYSTQNMTGSSITLNGRTGPAADFLGVDEFGGYLDAGVKIPLSQSFFLDAAIMGIVRSGTDFDEETSASISKIAIEPALRIGISFDIGQYFGTERYGEEDEPPVKKAPVVKP